MECARGRRPVTETADVPAAALLAILVDPRRHLDIDGPGMLRAEVGTRPLTEVGEVLTMAMHHPSLGDYRTDNHVVALEPDRRGRLADRPGRPPAGVRWSWTLEPDGPARTRVIHDDDWSQVVDEAVLARVSFPRVGPEATDSRSGSQPRVAVSMTKR